jgi:glutamyl/glutaminyl-tRNA synthetase
LERSDLTFEQDIIDNLKWLGIDWQEGPGIGGDFGPYRQSERLEIYTEYLQRLLKEDKAFLCFCSEEELEAQRQYAISQGKPWIYNGKCRSLSEKEVKKNIAEGKSSIIRFKTQNQKVQFNDLIRGSVEFDTALIGDFTIAKDVSAPLYNFAVVIDDFEMHISHVIRGEDHISNTPKQILIQEALELPRPEYAHLPLILGPDRTKLSKRHAAVSVAEYRKMGYLAESLINFMAFLGWNPGNEREIYSLPSLIKEFSLERVQKGGAVFNVKRLDFISGFYIRQKSPDKITELCLPYLIESGFIEPQFRTSQFPPGYGAMEIKQTYKIIKTQEDINIDYLRRIISLHQERLKKLSEISELTDYFFREKLEYDKTLLKWKEMQDSEVLDSLSILEKILSKIESKKWTKENLQTAVLQEAEKAGDRGILLWPFRVALTGKKSSAGPFEIADILGKEKTIKRVVNAQKLI